MAGTAAQVGVCWLDAGTCHTATRTNNTLKGEKIHNTLKGEKIRQACNSSGKKTSLSREGSRMVISRAALNYLGPQQPCPAPSPQVIPPSAAAPGSFWVTSDPCRSAVTIPPTSPQQGRMDLNKLNLLLAEGKQVCKGLLGTAMVSGKDRASPMGSFSSTNCMQNYLDMNHSKVALLVFLVTNDCCRTPV